MTVEKPWAFSPVGRVCCCTNKQMFPCHDWMVRWLFQEVSAGVAACTAPSAEVSHGCCLERHFVKSPSQHLLQWVSAVAQPICFAVPGLQHLSVGGWRNVQLCLNSECSSKQGRKMLGKDSTELSLASLSPKNPGSTKTQSKKLSGALGNSILYSFPLLLSTQGKICWN